MLALYRDAHNGSDATFAAEQDARYRQLFPAPFKPAAHTPESGGHTALLTLFTGSACSPCVAADLALDAILRSYPRTEVVGLAFDQHIPEPDPLANPDSVAVAARFGDQFTPTYALDGQMLPPGGGPRIDAEQIYKGLVKSLDSDIARPSGVQLQLTATLDADGHVSAQAHVRLPEEQELKQEIATLPVPPPPAKPGDKPADKAAHPAPAVPAPAAVPAPPAAPALQLNFALVEDDIRYSGENGIRFHPMVVRALAKPAGEGFPLKPDASATFDTAFDPAAISRQLSSYLDSYERHNDRFENTHFLSKDTSMNPANLRVVAWVENTADHRILQAAFVSLAPATHTGEAQ
jgi:pyruvate/2-oxoglutarate dehydrogenase complex dihydrolipoamide acyltransferase (E2) component